MKCQLSLLCGTFEYYLPIQDKARKRIAPSNRKIAIKNVSFWLLPTSPTHITIQTNKQNYQRITTMKLVQSFTMLTVTTGDEGAVANRRTRAIDDGSDEVMGARKKARCEEPTSPRLNPSSSISSRVNLRVDVNASLLASPRRVPNVRRSPIANRHVGDVLISDDEERSDNGDCKLNHINILYNILLTHP